MQQPILQSILLAQLPRELPQTLWKWECPYFAKLPPMLLRRQQELLQMLQKPVSPSFTELPPTLLRQWNR